MTGELIYESIDDAPVTRRVSPHRVVRASAGSGKTHRLAVRYLQLLRAGVEPRHILATTFTRKAAGEVQARVMGRLASACVDDLHRTRLGDDVGGDPLHQRACLDMLRTLTRSLHRLGISTIDAFFHRVAGAFRTELGLPREPLVIDDRSARAADLRGRAIEAMLAEAEDDEAIRLLADLLKRLHHDTAARSVTGAIAQAVKDCYDAYREAPQEPLWSWIEPRGRLGDEAISELLDRIKAMEATLPRTKKGDIDKRWEAAWRNTVEAIRSGALASELNRGIIGAIIEGKDRFFSHEISADWRAVGESLIGHIGGIELSILDFRNRATFDLLRKYESHYDALTYRERVVSFADVGHRLADVLPSLPMAVQQAVYFRLDGEVHHLLLDEFQDTSIAQWRVLEPMVEELVSHEAFVQAEGDVTDRGLFVVGDVKQAIYGWRGGCAELFDVVESMLETVPDGAAVDGEASSVERMDSSYRSSPAVLEAVNAVFGGLVGSQAWGGDPADEEAKRDWAAGFEAHSAAGDAAHRAGRVTLQTAPAEPDAAVSPEHEKEEADDDDDASSDASVARLDQHVAELIQCVAEAHRDWTIGVLTRRNSPVQRLLQLLRTRGVDASGESGNPLTDRMAVLAVLSALTLAEHPGDTASAYHVANSPLGEVVGLTTFADEGSRVAAAREIRRELVERGYAATIAGWVDAVTYACDDASRVRLTQLVELAERFDVEAGVVGIAGGDAGLRPTNFVRMVEVTPVEEPSPAKVRVMTIHRAKGLEFDAVVLPELHSPLQSRWQVLLERQSTVGPATAASRSTRAQVRALDPRLEAMHHDRRRSQRMEDLSLLYVAMTRARHELHMVIPPIRHKKDASKGFTAAGRTDLSYAALLRATLAAGVDEDVEGDQLLWERTAPGTAGTE